MRVPISFLAEFRTKSSGNHGRCKWIRWLRNRPYWIHSSVGTICLNNSCSESVMIWVNSFFSNRKSMVKSVAVKRSGENCVWWMVYLFSSINITYLFIAKTVPLNLMIGLSLIIIINEIHLVKSLVAMKIVATGMRGPFIWTFNLHKILLATI